MRVAVVSYKKGLILPTLKKFGHKIVTKNPELVIALGGDGTFLCAEEKYPNKQKLFIYHSSTCEKCSIHNFEPIISGISKLEKKLLLKIEADVKGKKLFALNDINIHYCPPRALRFNVEVNNKTVAENVIGDGVVVSTPFGSTAYYYSITGKSFEKGIGIAFNNPTKKRNPIVVPENSKIEIRILRENGVVAHDTSKTLIKIKKGDRISIQKCKKCTPVMMPKKEVLRWK